jgi:hypothetical protein
MRLLRRSSTIAAQAQSAAGTTSASAVRIVPQLDAQSGSALGSGGSPELDKGRCAPVAAAAVVTGPQQQQQQWQWQQPRRAAAAPARATERIFPEAQLERRAGEHS